MKQILLMQAVLGDWLICIAMRGVLIVHLIPRSVRGEERCCYCIGALDGQKPLTYRMDRMQVPPAAQEHMHGDFWHSLR